MSESQPKQIQETVQPESPDVPHVGAVFLPAHEPVVENRVTVICQIYHQTFGEQPLSIDSRYEKLVNSSEEPYQRKKVVGEDWQKIDLGFIEPEEAGMLVIQNLEGLNLKIQPSEEVRQAIKARVIQLTFDTQVKDYLTVAPGEFLSITSNSIHKMFVRCTEGNARYALTIIPR